MNKSWLETIAKGLQEAVTTGVLTQQTAHELGLLQGAPSYARLPTEPGNGMVNQLLLVRKTTNSLLLFNSSPDAPQTALSELLEGITAVEGLEGDDEEGLELKPVDESPEPADPFGGLTYSYGAQLARKSGKDSLANALSLRAQQMRNRDALRKRLYDTLLSQERE